MGRVWQRLKEDFRLAIMFLCGAFAIGAILPFGIFRFWNGQYLVGVIDLAIVLLMVGCCAYAWRSGKTRLPGLILITINVLGCAVVAALLGITGAMWAYTVIVMNFFLADRRPATVASIAMVILVAALPDVFATPVDRLTFVATASLISIYAFIHSSRTESHRRQVEALASVDPLTGTGNRRLMEHDLEQSVSAWRPGRVPASLAVLDLDHFKQVNDSFGHEAGDRVLVQFAEIVRGSMRKFDRLYRFGGEEFVLLMPATDPGGLRVALDKLHAMLGAQLRGPGGPVQVSAGGAVHAVDESATAWLARADAALYRAKRAGRNRVVIDGSDADADAMAIARGRRTDDLPIALEPATRSAGD
jgi:diguanylate cyclase